MLAYTNTTYTKEHAVNLALAHQAADRFIQGTYWDEDEQKGCSIGCMVKDINGTTENKNWHETASAAFGISYQLAYMFDRIFEGLGVEGANKWTVRWTTALVVGSDTSMVIPRLMHWLMTDPDGLRKHARPDGLAAINKVAELYGKKIEGNEPSTEEWLSARRAAYAADAAAYAAAAYAAADAAAYAAYAAAAYAAAADAAADAAYARSNFYTKIADKLIELLESAHRCQKRS